ncbi:ATP synthase F0 subunit B [Alicyclobacillaceae bacterium I2511]|nr:ATP synthase F0 subunit B [Alicyclobacillaceae bacterium I2511]
MFWLIQHFAFKPLAKMLEQRRNHVETQIAEAEQGKTEAEKLLAQQRDLLEQSRREARELLEVARVRADEQARQLVEEAQLQSQRILTEGRALIERERAEALAGVLGQVTQLTVELTTKLLRDHVSEAVHAEMLKEAEQKLGELVC